MLPLIFLSMLMISATQLNGADEQQPKNTKLLLYAQLGNPEKVHKYLQLGAEVNSIDNHGNTALHLVSIYASRASVQKRAEIIKLLSGKKANVSVRNNDNETSLEIACKLHPGLPTLFTALFDAENSPFTPDKQGETAFDAVAKYPDISSSKKLKLLQYPKK